VDRGNNSVFPRTRKPTIEKRNTKKYDLEPRGRARKLAQFLRNRPTLLNTDVQNCYITLEFITIIHTASMAYPLSSIHRIVKKDCSSSA